jgi:hypothetical protein
MVFTPEKKIILHPLYENFRSAIIGRRMEQERNE